MKTQNNYCQWGIEVIRKELSAISELEDRVNTDFARACEILLACKGRVVVLGLGKSGHIGNKIAATLASTGTPAFFVHAAEASHGDFGMITHDDVVLAISNSGKTGEILTLLPLIKHKSIQLISLTGCPDSPLAQGASVNIDVSVQQEAGPLDLAPTSSTTATLVMGDALAIALLRARGFSKEDFALSHPGGTLGKRLLLRVNEIMRTGNDIPKININAPIKDVLIEMSAKRLGLTTVVDDNGELLGVFTDGDLRRTLESNHDLFASNLQELITGKCKTTSADLLAYEVFNEMEDYKITAIPVVDEKQQILGIIHLHDILQAGVI